MKARVRRPGSTHTAIAAGAMAGTLAAALTRPVHPALLTVGAAATAGILAAAGRGRPARRADWFAVRLLLALNAAALAVYERSRLGPVLAGVLMLEAVALAAIASWLRFHR